MSMPVHDRLELKNERETLAAVRDDLRGGRIVAWTEAATTPLMFDMNTACDEDGCGSVACIGGHAWLKENQHDRLVRAHLATKYVQQFASISPLSDHPLAALYFPQLPHVPRDKINDLWNAITPEQAAQAIDNYLLDGNPRWAEIVGA